MQLRRSANKNPPSPPSTTTLGLTSTIVPEVTSDQLLSPLPLYQPLTDPLPLPPRGYNPAAAANLRDVFPYGGKSGPASKWKDMEVDVGVDVGQRDLARAKEVGGERERGEAGVMMGGQGTAWAFLPFLSACRFAFGYLCLFLFARAGAPLPLACGAALALT